MQGILVQEDALPKLTPLATLCHAAFNMLHKKISSKYYFK